MNQKELKKIERTMDGLEDGFLSRSAELFKSVLAELEQLVSKSVLSGSFDADAFEMPGSKRFKNLFERFIWSALAEGLKTGFEEVEAKRARYAWQDPVPEPIVPEYAVEWADGWVDQFSTDYYGDVTQDVVGTLSTSIEQGWSVQETMDTLGQYLTGSSYNSRRLETIARTNTTTAFNQGRLALFRQEPFFVAGVEFIAILDSRVTDICERRHGLFLYLDSPELEANTPPLHYNCRSVLSPVTKDEMQDILQEAINDNDISSGISNLPIFIKSDRLPTVMDGFGKVKPSRWRKVGGRKINLRAIEKKFKEGDLVGAIDDMMDNFSHYDDEFNRVHFFYDNISIEQMQDDWAAYYSDHLRGIRFNQKYYTMGNIKKMDLIKLDTKTKDFFETFLHEAFHSYKTPSKQYDPGGISGYLEEAITETLMRRRINKFYTSNGIRVKSERVLSNSYQVRVQNFKKLEKFMPRGTDIYEVSKALKDFEKVDERLDYIVEKMAEKYAKKYKVTDPEHLMWYKEALHAPMGNVGWLKEVEGWKKLKKWEADARFAVDSLADLKGKGIL